MMQTSKIKTKGSKSFTTGFSGTLTLLKLAIRRDRIILPASILSIVGLTVSSAWALVSTYGSYKEQLGYVSSSALSAAGRLFQGTVNGANIGSIMMAELFFFTAIIVAVISVLMISRQTRHNEETAAYELIYSGQVGRYSMLAAALMESLLFNGMVAVLTILMMLPIETAGISSVGTFYMVVSIMLVGLFSSAVSAVTCQLSDYRRGANMMAIGFLSLSFLVRGFGDSVGKLSADGLSVTGSLLSYTPPFGLGYQVLPYTADRVWPLFLSVLIILILLLVAFWLDSLRDLGRGIIASHSGRPYASRGLMSRLGIDIRMLRASMIAWMLGAIASGSLVAVMVNDFQDLITSNDLIRQVYGSGDGSSDGIFKAILSSMIPMMIAMLAAFAVSQLSRMSSDESSGRLESVLATAKSRTSWLIDQVVTMIGSGIIISMLVGISGEVTNKLYGGPQSLTGEFMARSLYGLVAMIVFCSVLVLLFTIGRGSSKALSWLFYIFCSLAGSLAAIFKWPQIITDISPFAHVSGFDQVSRSTIMIMLATSLILLMLASTLFNNRDITSN